MVGWASSGSGGKTLSEMSAINAALSSTPTEQMRKELLAAEVALPDQDELASLSASFTGWLEELRYNLGLPASHTYANLFSTVDEDVRHYTATAAAACVVVQRMIAAMHHMHYVHASQAFAR